MRKKQRSTNINIYSILSVVLVIIIWQSASFFKLVPDFMLPSPLQVVQAFISDFHLLVFHAKVTLVEAVVGLISGVSLGIIAAIFMDHFKSVKDALYPVLVLTQTIPTVAIAPLLTIWFGFGIMPKVVLIVITIFFPVSVAMLNGFSSVDADEIRLLRSMGANQFQIFTHIKLPASLGDFFSALRIAVTYAVIGAVISEWLGGFVGLGVYMTRVRKSYDFDKMFAVIFLISIISLLLVAVVNVIEKYSMPWKRN
ncbi:ABC transporter permease [Companilactobacillus jidongensis]|uniref:ABC transporter permease n=1 Tax=Companilactobacillus jidongensis TaxID=2486006 RepID=UPI0013DE20DB|nr:ABC transporter permease [Companilactobacillus jidongensis]